MEILNLVSKRIEETCNNDLAGTSKEKIETSNSTKSLTRALELLEPATESSRLAFSDRLYTIFSKQSTF